MRFAQACLSAIAVCLPLALANAQTVPQVNNPLRPQPAQRSAPAQTPQQAPAPQAEGEKPKRQRSAAQLANDNRMRQCGAEWRANKAALAAQGKTWRVFNVECRARLKAQGR